MISMKSRQPGIILQSQTHFRIFPKRLLFMPNHSLFQYINLKVHFSNFIVITLPIFSTDIIPSLAMLILTIPYNLFMKISFSLVKTSLNNIRSMQKSFFQIVHNLIFRLFSFSRVQLFILQVQFLQNRG